MTTRTRDTAAKVLVIDDEEQNLALIRAMMRAAGYDHVTTVQRSSEALDRFREVQPDLVLLDLHMPPPDGFALLRAFRDEVDPEDFLPVVVLSAEHGHGARERALAGGASDFVTKPLQLAEVLLRIDQLLERRRTHRRLRASHASVAAELARRHDAEQAEHERLDRISQRVRSVLDAGGPTMVYQPILQLPPDRRRDGFGITAEHPAVGEGTVPVPGRELLSDVIDIRDQPRHDDPVPVGLEALARFEAPPRQGPDRWFADAAIVQLALELELAAIASALGAVAQLPPGMFVSVNASWTTIVHDSFHEVLADVDGSKIVVELTEHERVADYGQLAEAVDRLHQRGTRLAVDDTGAGFASLDHILRLGPDIVKLDRNLVMGVDKDPIRRSMIAAFVHFGEETHTAVIAEGIESLDELETLRRLGVRHAQGYHLALPADLPTALASVGSG